MAELENNQIFIPEINPEFEAHAAEILKELDFDTENAPLLEQLDLYSETANSLDKEEALNDKVEEVKAGSKESKGKRLAYYLYSMECAKDKKLPTHEVIRRQKLDYKRTLSLNGYSSLLITQITKEHKRMIIPFMTGPFANTIAKTRIAINNRIARLIMPLIPMNIKIARTTCGTRSFIEHPGFMWIGSEQFKDLKVWVQPDIPYYFEQFHEMDILRKHYPVEKLLSVDKLMDKHFMAIKHLRKREAKLAYRVALLNTYEDLINLNPECAKYIIGKAIDEIEQNKESLLQ